MPNAIEERNKAVISRLMTEVDRGNAAIIDEVYSDDYVDHTPSAIRGLAPGKAGIKQAAELFYVAFPDIKHTMPHLLADGDYVVAQMWAEATHKGELFGVGPTGKKVTLGGIAIYKMIDGRITERWAYHGVGVLEQLGIDLP